MKLSIKNSLLLFLAMVADFYEEFSRHNIYRFWYEIGGSEYKKESYVQILSKMLKENEIKRKKIKNRFFLKFTSKAEEKLRKLIPQWRYRKRKWDKKWRLLIFDIEEKRRFIRNLLRNKLKELGFAFWQKSVYVSPFPIEKEINQYLKEKNLYPKAICFTAKKLGDEDDKELAYRIFHLGKLQKSYREILMEVNQLEESFTKGTIKRNELMEKIKNLYFQYQNVALKDPFLPEGLLPENWERDLIGKKIKSLLFEIKLI